MSTKLICILHGVEQAFRPAAKLLKKPALAAEVRRVIGEASPTAEG